MWQVKRFKSLKAQQAWCQSHDHYCQIVVLFVNNGYAVEWRRLRVIKVTGK